MNNPHLNQNAVALGSFPARSRLCNPATPHQGAMGTARAPCQALTQLGLDKPKIIFIDDEQRILDALRRGLRNFRHAWDFSFEHSALEALTQIHQLQPAVAIIDIHMPEMDGMHLSALIRAESPLTQCIILTGSADMSTAISCINSGNIFRFFQKPCPISQLAQGIEQAVIHWQQRIALLDNLPSQIQPAPVDLPYQLSLNLLNLLPFGVAVTDDIGHLHLANDYTSEILSTQQGLTIDFAKFLHPTLAHDNQRFQQAIALAAAGHAQSLTLLHTDREQQLLITMTALSMPHMPALVCLFLSKKAEDLAIPPPILGTIFGLTPSEAKLACCLITGHDLDQAAENCHITKHTARTYLKQIFLKLGVTRQAEMVGTILAAVMLPRPG